jgi:thiol:disulfide interchange protein/DsbC/DsbD-like thiol-disulfide interchange protein
MPTYAAPSVALALLFALPAGAEVAEASEGSAYDAHTEVELLAEQASVRPGEPFTLGLRMKPDPAWHTYWKNPGGSGERPRLTWHVPDGFELGELRYPTPEVHAYEIIGTNNYGYSREIVLPVEVMASPDLDEPSVRIVLEARWLTCDPRECIPGEATLALEIPVSDEPPVPSAAAPLFEAARAEVPRDPAAGSVMLALHGARPMLHFEPPGTGEVRDAYFFPEPRNLFDYGADQPLSATGAGYALALALLPGADLDELPERLRGVLAYTQAGERHAWQIDHAIEAAPTADVIEPGGASERGLGGLLWAIGLALVGGMLLNLMPCVFPILSLKVLGLVQSQGESLRHRRLHGLSYGAGVLVSFWVIAFVLIGLRGAGEQLNWGFHLQSPSFIAVMALLVFAIGLNLAGVFEVGSSLVGLADRAERKVGGDGSVKGAFGTGVLATTLATPCTAPLMGPAVGFALSQPPAVILSVLSALGLGMALPYVLLYWSPAVGRALPRPGAWMATLKQALAFPMFAVAVWLIWVFGNQVEHESATLVLLASLWMLSLGVWIFGRWSAPARSTKVRWAGRLVALVFVSLSVAAPLTAASGSRAAESLPWEPYSARAIDQLRADHERMVFVNFTADWCVNCQLLEQTVLASRRVIDVFARHDVALLKADWTSYDDHITEALARFERRSIPFFVLYPADPKAEPIVLGEWITRGGVERAVERAAARKPKIP